MNIEVWRDLLSKCNLLPEYEDVLSGFDRGFDQGIPAHRIEGLDWYTPENHRSSELAKEKIQESMKKELKAGRMLGPFSHAQMKSAFGFFRSNPLGAVVNGDGEIRPINDLSYPRNDEFVKSVNSYVKKEEFETTWDDFKIVSKFLSDDKRRFELGLFDWEKAYRQIPTRREQWRYLLVKDFDDNLLVDTRITFGGVAGCGSFGRPADAWKLIMKNQFKLVNVFRWVDDNLFVREENATVSMKEVVDKSDEMGVKTNVKKYSEFSCEQKFIGFVWNGLDKTVRLPEGKIEQRLTQIHPFMVPGASFDYEQAEVLVGRLNHVSYILPHLRCNLCSIYRWLKSWFFRKAKRPTPEDVLVDLAVWVETLTNFEHTRLIRWGPPLDVGWVGDASTSFGIGILVGKHWAQFRLLDPQGDPRRISFLETVAIRLGLIMLLKLRNQKGKSLIVWTDNTTTENGINNKKTKDKDANNEWMKIQRILVEESVDLVARRVKSKDNKADALSRGLRSGQLVKHQVVIKLPEDLGGLLEQVVFKI
ncbi:uncharacterized protein PGTG_22178 [Puccinia graminis f. sp. tritici CRL 75-36-700-3]|uniref:Reverse transcriptase domain-containing protein n=1 Tax=Puccinia graminis f. sp. tritici (strain CRL 75-36-700-3 / race SCCL) TaxID=418459 RepID=H6QTU8_PUCGT|nr:uncharacterized protein PGTG_22178 [Puccinia graminis f. sp. tritici CRL 75-36-700-3]EHS64354.1 hypothetical protein PGTG_22178 [Puccinia graminis f. sp. tritici CRL 75-36-700-3]